MKIRLSAILIALLPVITVAEPLLPRAYQATYSGRFSGAKIDIETSLSGNDSGEYIFKRSSTPRGLARLIRSKGAIECAEFNVSDTGVSSNRYHYIDGEVGKGKSSKVNFTASSIESSYKGATVTLNNSGAIDRMVEEIAILPKLAASESFTIDIVERNEIHKVHYRYTGTEQFKSALGKYEAKVYERRRGSSSRTTHFWYAPKLDYLPLQIERRKKNKVQGRAKLSALEWLSDSQALGNVTPVCP